PEPVDELGRDLAQPVAAEEPLQVSESPLVVVDRVLVDPSRFERHQRLAKTRNVSSTRTPSAAIDCCRRSSRGSSRGGTHVPRSICWTIRSVSSSARVWFQPSLLVPNVTFS